MNTETEAEADCNDCPRSAELDCIAVKDIIRRNSASVSFPHSFKLVGDRRWLIRSVHLPTSRRCKQGSNYKFWGALNFKATAEGHLRPLY